MEMATLLFFCGVLIFCVIFDFPILCALLAGLFLFCLYGARTGHSVRELAEMLLFGIKSAKNILIVFVLIGMLTALWRACGTIPVIICCAVRLIQPKIFILMAFLLNCGISVLTGTSFGTAATMGVICAMMGNTLGADPLLVGGAILSGIYFGDRCSPVSTSALLVSELTDTNIYDNIKAMLRTALAPFLLTCAVYAAAGLSVSGGGEMIDLPGLFGRELRLHWLALIPAAVILTLALLRINVKIAMTASILAAIAVCLFIQETEIRELLDLMAMGYEAGDREVGALLDGGGIVSMLKVMAIVCVSSSYAGIFQKTNLLSGVKESLIRLSGRITPLGAVVVTALLASLIACNQTLTIMLTSQLCGEIEPDKKKLAIELEDTAVVIPPLIPWSIAGAVPLAAVGAPMSGMLAACFLYLLPLCALARNFMPRVRSGGPERIKKAE